VKDPALQLPARRASTRSLLRLRWPLPALMTWVVAWALVVGLRRAGAEPAVALLVVAALVGFVVTRFEERWRRVLIAAGFVFSGIALELDVPSWIWALAALPLLLAYPLRAWADAPFFPTPRHALQPLAAGLPLPAGARVLDAGCGIGHGLQALRRAGPQVQVHGIEWSAPLAWLCRRRCRFAQVQRGDMWAQAWGGFELVYLFQRPESMPRAYAKARAELAPGAWLLSLEFEVPGVAPELCLSAGRERTLWAYRMPERAQAALNVAAEVPIVRQRPRGRDARVCCKS